jgi:hypothetical protein
VKKLVRNILREDELDWIREVNPLPPFPLSEKDLYPLIGWSILYDPHKPYGAWHQNGMTFPITKIQGGNVTWLYDNGKKENYDTITTFLSLINNGTWVLVSPEGVLYDPLYAREWKGGTYYSKEDLNESHEWDWARSEKLYNPFDEPLAVIWFDRTINRDEAEVLFGLMSEAGVSSHRSKQNLIKLFMDISKDSYLRIFRSNHYGQHFSIGHYDPHPDASSFDDIKYADVHKDLVGKPYLEYNVSDLFGNTINESDEFDWIRKADPHIPFNQVKRNHKYRVKFTDVFFDALRTCNVPQTMIDELSEVTVVVVLDKALKMKYNISFCNHERKDEVDTIYLTFVDPSSGNLFYSFYVTEDMLTLHDNNITESSEWSWVTDSEPYHDVEFYVGKPLKVSHSTSSVSHPKSDYRIERTAESPEAYNICWDEVIPDNEGAEGVYKVCTRYRATSIIRMFEDGTLSLDLEKLNESEDLQWIKDVNPMDPYQPYVGMKWKVVGISDHTYEIYEIVGLDDEIMSLRWKNDRGGYVELDDYKLVTYFSLVRGGNVEVVYDDINEASDDFDWARGSSLTPLTDYIETYGIEEIDIPNKLVGLRVILSPKSKFYGEGDDSNPIDVEGTITEEETHDNELTIMVDWDNGEFNSYAPSDLDLWVGNIDESEDPLQWIKDVEPEIKLEPNTIYWFKPNLTEDEIIDFAGKITNSDYFSGLLFRLLERPDVVHNGLKYFVVGNRLDELDGWCTSYPIKHVTRDYPSAKLVDARERFGYN